MMTLQVFFRKSKNFPKFMTKHVAMMFKWWLLNIARRSPWCHLFLELPNFCWRFCGVKMGKNVRIGQDVYLDVNYAKYITLEDDVWIASHSAIFAHRRVMDDYHKGERYKECPQKPRHVLIKRGACVGIGSLVTPGVTIGEGSVIGAGSVVVKDIPDWCLAAGSPCKVMRFLPEQGYYYNKETKQNEMIECYKDGGEQI
jgi:acetyltransferase-like isoleucine patch superfamily enzyme